MWSCSSSTPSALGVAPSWNPICHGYAESHSSGDRNDGVISCSIIYKLFSNLLSGRDLHTLSGIWRIVHEIYEEIMHDWFRYAMHKQSTATNSSTFKIQNC